MRLILSASIACALLVAGVVHAADASATAPPAAASKTPSLEDFLKLDAFGTLRISPTGEYIAATVPLPDRTSLVIFRHSDMKPTNHVTLPKNAHVGTFYWVNDTRILFEVAEKFGSLDRPQGTGEIFGVNADGGGQGDALVGMRASNGSRSPMMSGQSRHVSASLLDSLRNDDDNVLVSVYDGTSFDEVDRMNVKTGHLSTVVKAPVRNADFDTDNAGVVRFATGAGDDNRIKTYYRADANSNWELINDEKVSGHIVRSVGFTADNKTAILEIEESGAPNGIYAFDTATRKQEVIYRDDNTDPSRFLYSPEDGSVYGAVFQDGKPRVEYLDPDNRYAKQLRALQANFKDAMVVPTSYTKDGSVGMYVVYSDRIPSDYYLFDRKANKATYVASNASWFKPEMLSEQRPVSLKARDGLALEGLLTIPRGSDGRNLPLVVHPHGGPFGPYDRWGYDMDDQLLASRGYAVLQLNFRGSGGYGRDFQHAGYKQWGRTMQDDLTDATHWAIDQGIANRDRICIYGASYGGYASLMAVAKEPDLYRCAIGYVGVYDLAMMYHEGDIPERKSGENFLKETLGEAGLDTISPTKLAARIKVPVMMVAGYEDRRAPRQQTEAMRDALLHAGRSVDAKIYPGEAHGFYTHENRLDLYTRILAFLDRNIGSGATSAPAPAAH